MVSKAASSCSNSTPSLPKIAEGSLTSLTRITSLRQTEVRGRSKIVFYEALEVESGCMVHAEMLTGVMKGQRRVSL